MSKDWSQVSADLAEPLRQLRQGIPDVMKAFGAMDKALMQDTALSPKTKELIALALGVAARCDGCLAAHGRAAAKYGATREEVMETIGMAIYMGGGPSVIYGAQALQAFDQFSTPAA